MKLAIILGTRPEIIKMSPIIRACENNAVEYFVVHSGQHYDYAMDEQFFVDLKLEKPRYNLGVGSKPYHLQMSEMIQKITTIFDEEKPTAIIVQGDTNTVLAGALAANKAGVPIVHHEAGLRSYDIKMPEELNRIQTDHISDYLCAPTEEAVKHLQEEGIPKEKIFLSGNTVVDAVQQNLEIALAHSHILKELHVDQGEKFILATAHRAENVDDPDRLKNILQGLEIVAKNSGLPILFPIHPRTQNKLISANLSTPQGVTKIQPLGYLEFLALESKASLIITDSGGIQEEACILHVPCLTIRENTERPETLRPGINHLVGTNPETICQHALAMLATKNTEWITPFGDGNAGEKIIGYLLKVFV